MARSGFILQNRLFEPGSGGASVGFLDIISPCYGEIVVSWNVGIIEEIDDSLVIPWASDPSVTVVPTEVVIVQSPDGVPQTVLSGDVLYRGVENDSLTQRFMPSGRWSYYSMFLRYTDLSTGGSYYQRVASDAVIPTKDYGSTQQLWQRVPMHYRILDESLAEPLPEGVICGYGGRLVGPLYKFLSVIGFEMDRIRTLTDAFVVAKDPFLGSPRSLDLTAKLLGVPIQNSDLGDQRLRRLLNSIGFLRRSKGTLEALRRYLTSFIGTDLTVFQNGELRVHSQRINYAPNPKTLGASPGYSWRPALFNEAFDPRLFNFLQDQVTGDPLLDPYVTYFDEFEYVDGAWRFIEGHVDNSENFELISTLLGQIQNAELTTEDLTSLLTNTDEQLVAEYLDDRSFLIGQLWRFDLEIPVRNGDRVVFSTRGEGAENIIWARLVNSVDGTIMGAGRSVTLLTNDDLQITTDDDEVMTDFVPDPVAPLGVVDLANYVEMNVFVDEERTANKDGWITVNIEVLVDLREEGFSGDLMLVERNYFGSYFDGDTVFCGWFNGDPSVSDCRWEGTPNDSLSLYTEDYERTRQFIELVYRDLIPISTVGSYTLSQFDYVPGTEPLIPELRA
jgi:hypothetical protein